MRNPNYDILFEPVKIGPVTAPNRFYQTPHATGLGRMRPNSSAALRGIKAEGGWGVVCTEYCSIHPSADEPPYAFLTLWDDDDTRQLAQTSAAIHAHGALAGIELWHGGFHAANRETRLPLIGPMQGVGEFVQPVHVRAMTRDDIDEFRSWHHAAAVRAREAGFDIVYVYAGHDYLPFQFLSPHHNQRDDEYGGSLENRARLLRELIEDTRQAVGDRCAVAVRLAVDELRGERGITSDAEGREIVQMLAELPDLWDFALAGGNGNDSCSSRFSDEGYHDAYVTGLKSLTSKPVVSTGRFTSPDTMAGQVRRGVQDFIGAARPSIADPFLPNKINSGREDEIRECIGCNICRAANNEGAPLRCTQNPTMGEEWRRGWHPERVPPGNPDESLLIVGGGPAGLEAALVAAKRGYQVTLADARDELGGRLLGESALPGLQAWIRVRDYRRNLLKVMPNVDVYLQSPLEAEDVREFGADHVVLATGSTWRRDAVGYALRTPIPIEAGLLLTPDDIYAGRLPEGRVLIYDDDHYFTGGALAERFLRDGHPVVLVTPEATLSAWTAMTNELEFLQPALLALGLEVHTHRTLLEVQPGRATLACVQSGREETLEFDSLVLVTSRQPRNALALALGDVAHSIGDCVVPSSIADAVYRGHQFARELGIDARELTPRREHAILHANP